MIFSFNYFANTTYFKLSEFDDVSIIKIIQVKLSYFLCRIVPYTYLQGWGQAVQASLPSPHPLGYQSKIVLLILLILIYLIVRMYPL